MPSQLGIFLSKKQYLNATQLLTTTLSLGDGNLAGIEALREVRTELQTKKQILYNKLMEVLIFFPALLRLLSPAFFFPFLFSIPRLKRNFSSL